MARSALLAMRDAVEAYFAANGVSATVRLGWRERSRQDNQGPGGAARVVLIPGEFDSSQGAPRPLRAGQLDRDGPQNHVNLDPRLRALLWWHQDVTCSVWAVNPDQPNDEQAQIVATENLVESTIQALHTAVDPTTRTPVGFANIESWTQSFWTLPPVERAFGRELTFGFVLLVPMFDLGVGLAYPQPAVARNPPA